MAIVLDTDVIIRGEKGTFDLHEWLISHASEEIEIAAVTRGVESIPIGGDLPPRQG